MVALKSGLESEVLHTVLLLIYIYSFDKTLLSLLWNTPATGKKNLGTIERIILI